MDSRLRGNDETVCELQISGLLQRSLLSILLLSVFAGAAHAATYGVQCSCDPPGTKRPPDFDCAALCGGGSSGFSPGGGMGAQEQIMMGLFGSFMQGAMNAAQQQQAAPQAVDPAWAAQQRAAQEEAARQEALRRTQARERFLKEKAEAEGTLKGPNAPDAFELKDEEPPAFKPKKTILPEAEELLRRCIAADDAASRALLGGS